jgi:glutamate carboxypeptidase
MNQTGLIEAQRHLPATLSFLHSLVAINSFTTNPAGVRATAECIAAQFAPMGFGAGYHPASDPTHGPHLVQRRFVGASAPSIALISHLDTVFTAEEEARFDFRYREEGSRIYGPGTNDIKGGTAMIWLTLQLLRDLSPDLFEQTNWFVLHNACEEVISTDFRALCLDNLPRDTRACLIFEADGGDATDFSLVSSRKGRAVFRVSVEGRASHAGTQHREGVNAINHLARLVTALEAETDYAAGVTVNVGAISGGTVINRVPHEAHADLEMRAFDPEAFARTRARILALQRDGDLPRVNVQVLDESRPWPRNGGTDSLFALWAQTAATLHYPLRAEDRGGLSDGNMLWDIWPTLDGLGPRGDNCHCSEHSADGTKQQEWVDADSFVPKAVLNATAIARLLQA